MHTSVHFYYTSLHCHGQYYVTSMMHIIMLLILSAVRNVLAVVSLMHSPTFSPLFACTHQKLPIASPRKAEYWERSVSKQVIVLIISNCKHEACNVQFCKSINITVHYSHSFSLTMSCSESSPQMWGLIIVLYI